MTVAGDRWGPAVPATPDRPPAEQRRKAADAANADFHAASLTLG
jgi:hypothetical protein